MPPNNSFNPQPTTPQNGPTPEPVSGPPPAPTPGQPVQPASQPFGSPISPNPAPLQSASPFGVPAASASQPLGQPQTSGPAPAPALGQQPLASPTRRKSNKTMLLILAVVLVLLLVGGGVWWYLSQNQSQSGSQQSTGDPESVNTVAWVEPAAIPANLSKSSQDSSGATVVSYVDKTTFCTISQAVISLKDKDGNVLTSKQAVDAMLSAADAQGVSVTETKTGPSYTFADDHSKTFAFDSTRVTQSLNVTGVPFTSQENILLYQKFGTNIATLSYACPSEAMEANQSAMGDFVKQFALKTT